MYMLRSEDNYNSSGQPSSSTGQFKYNERYSPRKWPNRSQTQIIRVTTPNPLPQVHSNPTSPIKQLNSQTGNTMNILPSTYHNATNKVLGLNLGANGNNLNSTNTNTINNTNYSNHELNLFDDHQYQQQQLEQTGQIMTEPDRYRQLLRDTMNQDLVDLLRSQIGKLLEENEKILLTVNEYRQRVINLEREKREIEVDPSGELLILQSELGEARHREAELTVAFEELQHRIQVIDRLIETDTELSTFFNAVTISSTLLSTNNQPLDMKNAAQQSMDSPSKTANSSIESGRPLHRQTSRSNQQTPIHKTQYTNEEANNELKQRPAQVRSGLDSPQSDSGCSLTSHTTADSRECGDNVERPKSNLLQNQRTFPCKMHCLSSPKRMTDDDADDDEDDDEGDVNDDELPVRSQADDDIVTGQTHSSNYQMNSKQSRPKGFVSLLRRSRSSVAESNFKVGYRSEIASPGTPVFGRKESFYTHNNRGNDDPTTPTESNLSEADNVSQNEGAERKFSDRFSRFRQSFKQSFAWASTKPDFRMEALASRQGEARALLKLRETRMELLKVQSRCQTLQHHINRLEAINSCRMSEIESNMTNDRELRQEIRNLQTRLFQLEAEYREFKVNQRIREMELKSKLAESNLRLSHAEINNQQAVVWSQINKAHEAVSDLLTPAQSDVSIVSMQSNMNNNNNNSSHGLESPILKQRDTSISSRYSRKEENRKLNGTHKPSYLNSVNMGADAGRDPRDAKNKSLLQDYTDSAYTVTYELANEPRSLLELKSMQSKNRMPRVRDRSIDSMSDYNF